MLKGLDDFEKERVKPPEHRFADNGEPLFEASIRKKELWIDCFFIYSLIWAFGSVLTETAKKGFSNWLKKTIKEKDEEKALYERRKFHQE